MSIKEAITMLKRTNEMCEPSDFYSFMIVDADIVSPRIPLKKLILGLKEKLYAAGVII